MTEEAPSISHELPTLQVDSKPIDNLNEQVNGHDIPPSTDKVETEIPISSESNGHVAEQPEIPVQSNGTSNGVSNGKLDVDRTLPTDTSSITDSRLRDEETDHQSIDQSSLNTPASSSVHHHRTASLFSVNSGTSHNANIVFVKKALQVIGESKEAKKNVPLQNSVKRALESLNFGDLPSSAVIFEPLRLACLTNSVELKVASLDCLSKLFTFSIFDQPAEVSPNGVAVNNNPDSIVTPPPTLQLIDAAIETIANCFDGEGTDPKIELQVVRALLAAILNMPAHGASLLRAVRQIYNVFIFSLSPINQGIAQASLTQVINTVFERVSRAHLNRKSMNRTVSSTLINQETAQEHGEEQDVGSTVEPQERLTLQNMENFTEAEEAKFDESAETSGDEEDLAVKDAFLIFRAMCKLSVKALESESLDMRSHSVRSKLLSLHIIHSILKDHIEVFLTKDAVIKSLNSKEETRLIDAVRQYLCLALSRNAASPLAPVFEISIEIFWLMISNLRSEFKREIPVFWDEIYFAVGEMKTSTAHQKRYLLSIIQRLCNDSRCIIEFYLNYDCDNTMPNICERLIDYLTKLSLTRVDVTQVQKQAYRDNLKKPLAVYNLSQISTLSITNLSSRPPEPDSTLAFPLDYALKMTSISCTVAFLRSLFSWAQKGIAPSSNQLDSDSSSSSNNRKRSSTVGSNGNAVSSPNASFVGEINVSKQDIDDPSQFENLKQRKKALLEGMRQFNMKPKKGVLRLIADGFIASEDPEDIATFLLTTEGLDKSVLGEYLGEGDEKNIAIMHSFVDQMDFTESLFVDALRKFLQSFRLPGESQKIDRFMLKFAERYLLGNPSVFANADTAYVLAYSVILLNTDLHSPQVKNRMGLDWFLKNNSGIDDGGDLPREFMVQIYDEIQNNEIKLHSEQHAALLAGDLNTPQPGGFFASRDTSREAYIQASREMSTKTERLVRTLGKKLRGDSSVYYVASHVHHVKSIFDTLWMSILAGLTPPFKEFDEADTTHTCLEGIKLSIRIACMFDLDYARTSFMGALNQFQNLNNYEDIKPKNIDAVYVMLEIAVVEGNNLKSSWKQILTSISQIERLQLIAQGIDSDSLPDVTIAKLANRNSIDSTKSAPSGGFFSNFSLGGSQATHTQVAQKHFHNQQLTPEAASLLTSTDLDVAIDRVFTNSAKLSGESIIEFVKSLSEVSAEEIESSGQSSNPRMYSLQKVIDVCYYNMDRIRVEWSHLWNIMGATFNTVGCHSNPIIVFFALDSLRQLSMRFLEIEELSHFKFQKEFLKPFEYIITNNESIEVEEMVLECINNMLLAKAEKVKSGWKTIFGVLTIAAKGAHETLVFKSFEMASAINHNYFDVVYSQDAFTDLVECFTELTKNEKFQRISLPSLDVLRKLIRKVAKKTFDKDGNIKLENNKEIGDTLLKLWYPILRGFHDIIMNGEDLEVRARTLNHLFDLLDEYGSHFEDQFWDRIWNEIFSPMFAILSQHWEVNQFNNNDSLSVWLSTTLIQALKNMISLFTKHFDSLNRLLDSYLVLLTNCICQENDTIARIGRSCLQDLIIRNAANFDDGHWNKVTVAFGNLFDLTTAKELFKADPLNASIDESAYDEQNEDDVSNADLSKSPKSPKSPKITDAESRLKKSKDKSAIVVKCVLQLLMIETLSELFQVEAFYEMVPYKNLIEMATLLNTSYKFAREFNDDYNLRVRLWNAGVIERLPNLLKQESSASAVYIDIMFKVYCDDDKSNAERKAKIISSLIPMCISITERYVSLEEATHSKNINTWKPVVIEILQGYVELDESDFIENCPTIYDFLLKLFDRGISPDLRTALKAFLTRVSDVYINERKE